MSWRQHGDVLYGLAAASPLPTRNRQGNSLPTAPKHVAFSESFRGLFSASRAYRRYTVLRATVTDSIAKALLF